MEQYGVDIKDLSNYSLVLDTSNATPEEVAERLIGSFEEWKANKDYKMAYITPERLWFPDDAPNQELVVELSSKLENFPESEYVEVVEEDGEFYLVKGLETALAYSFNMDRFIPAKLVKRQFEKEKYTRMKNSL